jgi:hypothetical protein
MYTAASLEPPKRLMPMFAAVDAALDLRPEMLERELVLNGDDHHSAARRSDHRRGGRRLSQLQLPPSKA